jgi:hypothetical protein
MHTGRSLAWLLTLGWSCALACARGAPPASRTTPPVGGERTSAPTTPAPTEPRPQAVTLSQPTLSTLKGDEALPEPWLSRFRAWLSAQEAPPYEAVTETFVISNAASLVLLRHTEGDGVCYEGPSKLDLIEYETGGELTVELDHFGDDCCPGTQCTRGPDGWNLRYLSLLAAKNWQDLSLLVPAKKKLSWVVNGEKPSTFSRKDVANGRFADAPSCGLMYNVTGCSEVDERTASFSCRCDGGGYHVTYDWEREGDGFVLVAISESSH